EVVRLGVVAGRLPVATVGTYVQIAIQDVAFELDLFLEQRVQDDGRRAGVLHPPDGVEVARSGGRRWNQRTGQLKPEIGRREIRRHWIHPSWPAARSAASDRGHLVDPASAVAWLRQGRSG